MRSIRSARIASTPATSALSSAWSYGSSEGPIDTSYPRSRSMSTAGGGTRCVTTTRTCAPLQTSTGEAIDEAASEGAVAVARRAASADDVEGVPEDDRPHLPDGGHSSTPSPEVDENLCKLRNRNSVRRIEMRIAGPLLALLVVTGVAAGARVH